MISRTPSGPSRDELELPGGRVVISAPPALEPRDGAGGALMNVLPMLGSVGSIVLVTTMGGAAGGRGYLAAGMFLLSTLGFVAVQVDRQRSQRVRSVSGARSAYLRHLAAVRGQVRAAIEQQHRALSWRHPEPTALPALAAEGSRVWSRSVGDGALRVRYGVAAQPLALELVAPERASLDRADPVAAAALHRLLAVHRCVPDLPATLDLADTGAVEVCGAPEPARALARALICSATTFHSPERLTVAVLCPESRLAHWDWVKWLPHARSPHARDAVGPRRLVGTRLDDLAPLLATRSPRDPGGARVTGGPGGPHLLLVTDGGDPTPPRAGLPTGWPRVTRLDLPARWGELVGPGGLRLDLGDEPAADGRHPLRVLRRHEDAVIGRADRCDPASAEALARRLASLHHADSGPVGREAGAGSSVPELLGLGDVRTFDPATAWRPRAAHERLRVPIGLDPAGHPVHLDLKESAQQGMGPHGLLVGATGSGKSELLRTLVLGLAATHSPGHLNLVLVDFKGGATFAGMAALPHVSAVITNLAEELALVDRMHDALAGEMVRRQELLRAAGNLASVHDHDLARRSGAGLRPLPSLVVVVDEFSELLSVKPELIDLFVTIGRLGRSLGLHLLLASQRLEEGRLRGLESHLSYRIGLRTFSAAESRAVLGVADAHELPPLPGLGYLRDGPSELVRFRAAHVSGPPPRPPARRSPVPATTPDIRSSVRPFTIAEVPAATPPSGSPSGSPPGSPAPVRASDDDGDGPPASLLDLAVGRMRGHGPVAHRVWLPPLDRPDTLGDLLGDLRADPHLGLVSTRWRGRPGLVVPLGTVDLPHEQRRDPLTVDLAGVGGHVAVVGGPRSGKSTLLRTLVSGLALTTTPQESQVFVLDFGGGTCASLSRLPHVSGTATRAERDVVRRILAEVRGVAERREAYFARHAIDSIETYRALRAAGRADDGYGDVFLVVDGWSTLRVDFEDLELDLQHLAGRGLTYGVHVLAGAARWADFRTAGRDLFGTRIELRLGDPSDSEIDRSAAARVPVGRPGRGLVSGARHVLTALPRLDGHTDDLVARVATAWPGPPGPELRLLPERVELAALRERAAPAPGDRRLLLGLDEQELAPLRLDPDLEAHLLLLGDGRSGKSSTLRTYLREVMRTRRPDQAQILLVDYRRSLLGEVPEDYRLEHLGSATRAEPALRDLATYLEGRLPGPEVTTAQLRERSWWRGAEVFVVIDDYDLVATRASSPVHVLQPLLAQAGDVGLHLVVARRCGGAARALYDPVLQSLRDLASPGLLLAGSPEEGPLLGGQCPQPGPPGRGRLITRDRGVEVLQVASSDGGAR